MALEKENPDVDVPLQNSRGLHRGVQGAERSAGAENGKGGAQLGFQHFPLRHSVRLGHNLR